MLTHTNIINADEIKQLEQDLNFDRYHLHALGKNIATKIERAKEILDNATQPLSLHYKFLCHQVGLYYALYKRSKALAKPYLDQYLKLTEENTYEQAEAYGLLAYIEIIQGGYHEHHENTPLNIALNILKNLDPEKMKNIELRIFLEKYAPLMLYRDSYLNLDRDDKRKYIQEDMDAAIQGIKAVIKEAEEYNKNCIDIDRAESLHLLGAMLIKQDLLNEAREYLELALQLEMSFSKSIAVDLNQSGIIYHWMTYTTGQTLADLYRRENNSEKAIALLQEVLQGQINFFAPLYNHTDIAKTLDFIANAYRDNGNSPKALDYYLQTLRMKEIVLEKNSPLIKVTVESLSDLLDKHPELCDNSDKHLEALRFINPPQIEKNPITTFENDKLSIAGKSLHFQPATTVNTNVSHSLEFKPVFK